jgi:hypothetical protein
MAYYSTREDAELVFGQDNIQLWADADNDNTALSNSRVEWALKKAFRVINGKFYRSRYVVPFDTADVPELINELSAMLSGIFLFDTRRVVDAVNPDDQVSQQRMDSEKMTASILAGTMDLLLADGTEAPQGIVESFTPLVADVDDDVLSTVVPIYFEDFSRLNKSC